MSTIISSTDLPAPRLELRWHKTGRTWAKRECAYNLVIPLREHDLRRENEDGDDVRSERTVEIGRTQCDGGPPPDKFAGEIDTPFRDGAHAQWDAEVLKLPVYAVCGDKAMLVEPKGVRS